MTSAAPHRAVGSSTTVLTNGTSDRRASTSGFAPEEIEALAQRCPQRKLAPGECLFAEGRPQDSLYVVRRGLLGLGRRINGRRLTFLLLRPGDLAGDEAALLGTPALTDAFAVTEAAVVVVPAVEFLRGLDLRSNLARRWAAGVGERVSALQSRLEEVLAGDLRSRLASLLLRELGEASRVVGLTQQTIADLLGVRRTSVTRTLQELQRQGILELGYGHIVVRDAAALKRAAGTTRQEPAIP